jgi:uncharacterized protein YndB with AHSA1/START domain
MNAQFAFPSVPDPLTGSHRPNEQEQAMTIPHAAADGLRVVYLLRAPAGQVWDAMTDTRKFGFWFGARLDGVFAEAAELTGRLVPTQVHPGLGRAMKPYLGITFTLSVERFEPGRLLTLRWQPAADATWAADPAQAATLVSFALDEVPGATSLTVTESALRDDPRLWRPRELAMLVEKFLTGARDLRRAQQVVQLTAPPSPRHLPDVVITPAATRRPIQG